MDEPQEDVDKVKDGPCCGRVTIAMFNATWVGICFLGLFSSFNPIQALQSGTIRNDYGFYGIAVLYGTFSIATLVASQVVRVLGQKIGLFLGALCYLIYIATLLVLALIPDISDDAYRVRSLLCRGSCLIVLFLRLSILPLLPLLEWERQCCGLLRDRS